MVTTPAKPVAVFARARYYAESLALALARQLSQTVVAIFPPESISPNLFETVLINMDVGLDTALDLTRAITKGELCAKVVLVGIVESNETAVRLAEAGSSGYTTVSASLSELASVVKSVQRGEFTSPPEITYSLFSHLADLAFNSVPGTCSAELTIRERQVMELLTHNLTNREIGERLCISEHTVKNHIHRILEKTGERTRYHVSRLADSEVMVAAKSASGAGSGSSDRSVCMNTLVYER
jgi:DNA-binding NarL/FixJ family response regulator